jgi:hypothetical protein
VLLLSPAYCAIWTVWSVRKARVETTFLSFANPPVLQSVQEHFCSAHPTNPLARCIEARLRTRWYAVDIDEEV